MLRLEAKTGWLATSPPTANACGRCQQRQFVCFVRAGLLFAVNFHALAMEQVRSRRFVTHPLPHTTRCLICRPPSCVQVLVHLDRCCGAVSIAPAACSSFVARGMGSAVEVHTGALVRTEVGPALQLRVMLYSDRTEFGGRGRPGRAVVVTRLPQEGECRGALVPGYTDAGLELAVDLPARSASVFSL